MKKGNKLMKVSTVLVTALMAASAVGMTTSANEAQTMEALKTGKTVKTTAKGSRRAKGSNVKDNSTDYTDPTISLVGGKAKPKDIVEVPIVMNTNNQCTCYDVLIEYDARLNFEGVEGAQAFCNFEENGRKFVSVVGYDTAPYTDGEAVAKIKLSVPDGAENDDYEVRFSQVTSFSTDYADFEDYKTNNAVIKITGGVEKREGDALKLMSVTGIAGDSAVVQLVPSSGNKCAAYDLLVEYDSRLLLEDKDVAGANAFCIFERDGKSYVSLVGYTADIFADGQAMAALNFHIPDDATAEDGFEVNIVEVKDFASGFASFENYETKNAVISVYESSRPDEVFKEFKVFKKFSESGALMGSAVGMRGDSNSDGKADVRDAAATAQFCASKNGVDEMGQFFGDVDDNGKMDVRDAAKIARYVATGRTSWDAINGK